jgi:predicted lipoprotein with Yx(FWY)xxD motif
LSQRKTRPDGRGKLGSPLSTQEVIVNAGIRAGAAMALLVLAAAGAAVAEPTVVRGTLLTKEGMTLYTFDNDVAGSGKSVCNGACAGVFPPYLAGAGETAKAPWSLVIRDDGARQWAYKGRPLYRFYADGKKGDAGGDGMNRNIWHVARL